MPNNLGSYRNIFHPGRNVPVTLTGSGASLARPSCASQVPMGTGWTSDGFKRWFAAFSFPVPSPCSLRHPNTLFFWTASLSLLPFPKGLSILTLIYANKCWLLCNCCLSVVCKYSPINCLLFKYRIFLLVFSKALVTYCLPINVLMIVLSCLCLFCFNYKLDFAWTFLLVFKMK